MEVENGAWNFDEEDAESLLMSTTEEQISKEML